MRYLTILLALLLSYSCQKDNITTYKSANFECADINPDKYKAPKGIPIPVDSVDLVIETPKSSEATINLPISIYVDRTFMDKDGYWQRYAIREVRRIFEEARQRKINLILADARIYMFDILPNFTDPTQAFQFIAVQRLSGGFIYPKGVYTMYLTYSKNPTQVGGVAFVSGRKKLTRPTYDVGACMLSDKFQDLNVIVFLHELGHLMGSPHTHACAWNGNNTRIDNCSNTEGNCESINKPGCIMSYCSILYNPIRYDTQVFDTITSNMRDLNLIKQ